MSVYYVVKNIQCSEIYDKGASRARIASQPLIVVTKLSISHTVV